MNILKFLASFAASRELKKQLRLIDNCKWLSILSTSVNACLFLGQQNECYWK